MVRFTIRELVLLTLVVAMSVGWWLDHAHLAPLAAESERNADSAQLAILTNRHLIAVLKRVLPNWQDRYPFGSLPETVSPDEN